MESFETEDGILPFGKIIKRFIVIKCRIGAKHKKSFKRIMLQLNK